MLSVKPLSLIVSGQFRSDSDRCWAPIPTTCQILASFRRIPWPVSVGFGGQFSSDSAPWENGYVESFNGRMRDEFLNGEIFHTLLEAKILIEQWRRFYNTKRPHSSLGYRPPAPESIQPTIFRFAA